jgi:(2R)-ethylmalonyl-CoA mutase
LAIDPAIEREQVERLAAFRAARDAAATSATLRKLKKDAEEDRNLMPAILESVSAGATLGEVVANLKEVFGEHRPGG